MLDLEGLSADVRAVMEALWLGDRYRSRLLSNYGHVRYREAVTRHVREGDHRSLYAEVSSFQPECVQPDAHGIVPDGWARRLVMHDFLSLYNCAYARVLLERGETHAIVTRLAPAYVPSGDCLRIEGLAVPLDVLANGFRGAYLSAPNRNTLALPMGPQCRHGIRRLSEDESSRTFREHSVRLVKFRDYGIPRPMF